MSAARTSRSRVVLVPTLREAGTIVPCLERVAARLRDCDLLVVDDLSPDGTAERARAWAGDRAGVEVWSRPDARERPGLGRALRAGWARAAARGYRIACVLDADLQQSPEDARRLLDLVEGGVDLAVGARASRFGGATDVQGEADEAAAGGTSAGLDEQVPRKVGPPSERLGRALAAGIRAAFRVPWRDPSTDFLALRLGAYTPEIAASMRCAGHAAVFELRWRLAHDGATIREIPVACAPRREGRSSLTGLGRAALLHELAGLWREDRRARAQGESDADLPRSTFAAPRPDLEARARALRAEGASVRLHLACGKRFLPGWLHVDIDPWPHLDWRGPAERLPMLADGSVDEIYTCHHIGYYDRAELDAALREWHRLLRPGGRIRIATADFAAIVEEYRAGRSLAAFDGLLHGRYPLAADSLGEGRAAAGAERVPVFYRASHDLHTLSAALRAAGFREPRRYDWRETGHADVDDYAQAYLPHLDREAGRLMSLNVEARA